MPLSMHDFVKLLFAMLAKESNEVYPRRSKTATIRIPFNYRERIENILCAGNGWKEEFSILIDTEDYFEDHFFWEERLSIEMLAVAKQLNRKFQFDLVNEQIILQLSFMEVNSILSSCKDEEVKKTMKHFASLVLCSLYGREHQEEFVDYTARSRKLMHELLQEEYRRGIEND